MIIKLYFDGACLDNDVVGGKGRGGCGAILQYYVNGNNRNQTIELKKGLGVGATNNIAEYEALIMGIEHANFLFNEEQLKIYGDSNLVVNMVSGKWGWKKKRWVGHHDKPHLQKLLFKVRSLLSERPLESTIEWIPREQNTDADALSDAGVLEGGDEKWGVEYVMGLGYADNDLHMINGKTKPTSTTIPPEQLSAF